MPWPTPQEFSDAVQTPAHTFSDTELKGSEVKRNALGLPVASSGNFATVYQFTTPGGTLFAVRVFNRDLPEKKERYACISRKLRSLKLSFTVSFDYLEKGILINGLWYPILKMDWVDGQHLHEYLLNHLHEPDTLIDLAREWLSMLSQLQKVGIAHGDLQHGNVLVCGGKLKLIDYDGMFLPELVGLAGTETGHRNYQHPQREKENYFGYLMDNFSAFVIYASILALSHAPDILNVVADRDDCILFKRNDYLHPESSAVLAQMKAHASSVVRSLANTLLSFLELEITGIPPLSICAPMPVRVTSQNVIDKFALLGLTEAASTSEIESARKFFLDVWGQQNFGTRKTLKRRARLKSEEYELIAAELMSQGASSPQTAGTGSKQP